MDALRAVLAKVDELDLPEGDMLMIVNNLKTVYQALPQNVKTVDVDVPVQFRSPPTEMEEIASAEGLWKESNYIKDLTRPDLCAFAKAFYDFFTNPVMTVEELSESLKGPFPLPKQPGETWTPRQHIDYRNYTLNTQFNLVYITEALSNECAEAIQNFIDTQRKGFNEDLGIIVKARIAVSLPWLRNLQTMLKESMSASGEFNQQTHFTKGLVCLSNVKDDVPHHTIKIDIDIAHPMFIGNYNEQRHDPVFRTLTLATSYIKLGGHTGSVRQIYNWIAFKTLLGAGATSQMIKVLKKHYGAHDGWRMAVSGITAKTRNKIRTYDCGFAVAQYASKLNNGELKISASKK